jgi:DNA mismatch repair protein MutS
VTSEGRDARPPAKPSAVMAQYLRIKAQHQLLFRLGDFYEMFNEDARDASAVLDLTLTARNRGEPDEIPLCGFPAHAAAPYITRLLAAGRTVAICEQAAAIRGRGLMEREVVRVITPGTILEEDSLTPETPSWLVGLGVEGGMVALAAIDFAAGTFRTAEIPSWEAAREELARFAPRELLLAEDLPPEIHAACAAPGQAWALAPLPAPTADVIPGSPLIGRVAGGVLAYVDASYRRRPAHLRAPEAYEVAGFLQLDAATRRNLELLQTTSGERRGSLLWVLDDTRTPMGARQLRERILYPVVDPLRLGARLDAVQELVERADLRCQFSDGLQGIGDLERLAGRLGARSAGPRDLMAIAQALDRIATLQTLCGSARSDRVRGATAALDPLPAVAAQIRGTLVEAPPPHTRIAGYIRAGHHPEIDHLRTLAQDGKGWLARFEAEERARTGIGSLKVRYNKVFGYYLEVTKANLGAIPSDYERKQTLVGAERFVTPALKEHEAQLLGAEERVRVLEQHCFDALLEAVAAHQPTLARCARAVAALDVQVALASVAHRRGWVRPQIVREPAVRIIGGRHPVVEAVAREPFVPNPIELDADLHQVLLLTGPNMGGKSTYLRQVALLVLLAHMGSFVPATEATIGLTDRIFTRVGASDNLVSGESTFMVEMRETANILRHLTPRSLVVLDEIGRGTSTFDGISIAWAVAEYLHDAHERPRTLFATHYHELTALAAERPRVQNWSVAVTEWQGDIVFLRQVVPGPASRSYGVEVARLAGVPPSVVDRARVLLRQLEAGESTQKRRVTPRTTQLELFAGATDRLRQELAALDPDRMTPLDALHTLNRLVAQARGSA